MNFFSPQLLFWFSIFLFVLNAMNFFVLLIFSELSWVSIFLNSMQNIIFSDDISFGVLSFYILALGGLEFCLGMLLLFLFKQITNSLTFFFNYMTSFFHIYN